MTFPPRNGYMDAIHPFHKGVLYADKVCIDDEGEIALSKDYSLKILTPHGFRTIQESNGSETDAVEWMKTHYGDGLLVTLVVNEP